MSPRLLALLLLAGCYESGQPDVPVDVGPVDAPRGACEPVGSMPACGPECGGYVCADLPERNLNCTGIDPGVPPPTSLCMEEFRVETFPDDRSHTFSYSCNRDFSHRGDHACWHVPRGSRTSITETDCDAVTATFGPQCYWSDGSLRTRTPAATHTACPAEPAPATVLCGGPCGHCYATFLQDLNDWEFPCVGRNDARDLGVCALHRADRRDGCSPDVPASLSCPDPELWMTMDYPEVGCVCLSFREGDGFARTGWAVPRSNCAAYRAVYPGEVECYDDAWSPLP